MSSAERERVREERRAKRHSQQRAARRASRREAPQEARQSVGTRQRRAAAGAAGYARYELPERGRYASPRRERYASPDEERYESPDEDPYSTPERRSRSRREAPAPSHRRSRQSLAAAERARAAPDADSAPEADAEPAVERSEKTGAAAALPPRGEVNQVKDGRVFPFTGIDNLALLMEDHAYQTVCFSMYMFRSVLDYKSTLEFFEVLAQLYPKFRYVIEMDPKAAKPSTKQEAWQKPGGLKGGQREGIAKPPSSGRRTRYGSMKAGSLARSARWVLDEEFRVSENIHVVRCRGPGDQKELNQIAGDFLGRHFDFNKPVWEAMLVHGLQTEEGARSALMIKIHHCFSDGQGMIQSYHAALTAMSKDQGVKEVQRYADQMHAKRREGKPSVRPSVGGSISHAAYTVRELYFQKRRSFVYTAKRPRVAGRLYSHSEGIRMDAIKLIRQAYSTEKMPLTINDVALAILARAMKIASDRLSVNKGKRDNRAAIFVPISLRPEGNWELCNFTSGSVIWVRYLDMTEDAVERQLESVHKEMRRIKKSQLPTFFFRVLNSWMRHRLLYMPNYAGWHSIFYRAFSEYHVASNVPGPTEPVRFGRHEAYSYHVLPPSSPGKATMAIGMISYAKDFSLAVSCDDVPEFHDVPDELCRAFQQAATTMIDAARAKLAGKEAQ